MSIIHQELKKIQRERQGFAVGPRDIVWSRRDRNTLLKWFFLSSLSILGISIIILLWTIKPWDFKSTSEYKGQSIEKKEDHIFTSPDKTVSSGARIKVEGAKEHNTKGIELYKKGRFTEAIHEFEIALSLNPVYAEVYNNIGLAYKRMGQMEKAKINYENALRYRADYPEALNNYGILLGELGRAKDSMEYLKKATQLDPLYPDPHLNMAILLEKEGRIDEAIIHYKRFLSLSKETVDSTVVKEVREKVLYLSTSNINNPGLLNRPIE